ncbi:MAG: xylose isomerase [Alphaproteobacteria bacterium]|nr:MAG: xylose isomerase [Alphaproteobacteria bacterium]
MADSSSHRAGEDYFKGVGPIGFEGRDSRNPLAFRYYDKDQLVLGKRMEDHLRLAVCYWHSFCWDGSDVFGAGTFGRPWLAGKMDAAAAKAKMDVAFEFFSKLGAPYYCFHDVDVMAEAQTLAEHTSNFAAAVDGLEAKMQQTGMKLLWGTANLFSHPRFAAGAATNPNPEVFAFAAAQVRQCIEATKRLGGENYVLWGGREGYDTLLNTDMARELDQMGRFLSMVVEHKHKIGFKGMILLEPKPHEPTKHQYDHDVATVYGFLKRYGLENEVRVNIEANHATLAGHSFEHEVETAAALGIMGSFDINRGDPQNGWDTDQFPNDPLELTLVLYRILKAGGLTSGGFNFDAKLRRQSLDPVDLFHGHIGGIDQLARALLQAEALIEDGCLTDFVANRYAGWNSALGQQIMAPGSSLADIADAATKTGVAPAPVSGRQEYLENLVARFV